MARGASRHEKGKVEKTGREKKRRTLFAIRSGEDKIFKKKLEEFKRTGKDC